MKKHKKPYLILITLILFAMFYVTKSSNSYEMTECSGTQVSVTCHDAPSWNDTNGNFYGRVCDNTKCGRAWMDESDGSGDCTYCNTTVY